jgi:beta-RFAP synthase
MTKVRIQAPGRLHFGLLGWGTHAVRQFGGFGLMIDNPFLELVAEHAEHDEVISGSTERACLSDRLMTIRHNLESIGLNMPPTRIQFEAELPAHHGLGSGTQATLAMTEAAMILSGIESPTKSDIVARANRFPRSGVGTHGYFSGGLIVDEGHPAGIVEPSEPARLSLRSSWPEDWHIVTIVPDEDAGHSGKRERAAFETLPHPTQRAMSEVSDIIHQAFLPAFEAPAPEFEKAMNSLETVQRIVGGWFAPAQGGHLYGSVQRDRLIDELRELGLRGLGQSSWGPTIFGFSRSTPSRIRETLDAFFNSPTIESPSRCRIVSANNQGRRIFMDRQADRTS